MAPFFRGADSGNSMEAATRFELVNSGFADRCLTTWLCRLKKKMERETGFEPATSTLARSHSTTELFPLSHDPENGQAVGMHQALTQPPPPAKGRF
jgi:hypothetical protein